MARVLGNVLSRSLGRRWNSTGNGLRYPESAKGSQLPACSHPSLSLHLRGEVTCRAKGPATATGALHTPANSKQPLPGLLTGLFLDELNAGLALGKTVKVGKSASGKFSSCPSAARCPAVTESRVPSPAWPAPAAARPFPPPSPALPHPHASHRASWPPPYVNAL